MKHKSLYLAVLASAMLSPLANAASDAHLKVIGKIQPDACDISLSNNGSIDFGDIPVKALEQGNFTYLAAKEMELTIQCTSATATAFTITDNKSSTMTSPPQGRAEEYFGLGMSGENKIGGYRLSISKGNGDGTAFNGFSNRVGTDWVKGRPQLQNDSSILVAGRVGENYTPQAYLKQVIALSVTPRIAPSESLGLTNEAVLDGQATFTLHYL